MNAKRDVVEDSLQLQRQRSIDTVLILNLLRTHQILGPCLDDGLREQQLTASQWNALLLLHAAGNAGLSMREIGDRLIVTKANVTGLVDRLERVGLAERWNHEDRRITIVRLTSTAQALVERLLPQQTQIAKSLTDCLSTAEKETLIGLLSKLRRNLREKRKQKG